MCPYRHPDYSCGEAKRLGVNIRLGSRIENINFDKPSIKTRNGDEFHADLTVGADGLKSVCRELLLGRPEPPRPTGIMAYRIQIDMKDMMQHPELVEFVSEPNFVEWYGPHKHILSYFIRREGPLHIALYTKDTMPESVLAGKGTVQEVLDLFKDWDPKLQTMLTLVQDVLKWRVLKLDEMKQWSHPSGSLILIGDACHLSPPYLAMGAAMAIEDGAVLGNIPQSLLYFPLLYKISCIPNLAVVDCKTPLSKSSSSTPAVVEV
jgi:salicylate hydroxylase